MNDITQDEHGHGCCQSHADEAPASGCPSTVKLVKDPVCGMSVDPATTTHKAEHGGEVYFFCSGGCRTKFLADPAGYVAPGERVFRETPVQPKATGQGCGCGGNHGTQAAGSADDTSKQVKEVLSILKSRDVPRDTQTWNRRYREYMEKIKTGSVFEIAEVMRDLSVLRATKDLSFGERKMLETARGLLIKELALAKGVSEDKLEAEVDAIFAAAAA